MSEDHHPDCFHRSGAIPPNVPCPCRDWLASRRRVAELEAERERAQRDAEDDRALWFNVVAQNSTPETRERIYAAWRKHDAESAEGGGDDSQGDV